MQFDDEEGEQLAIEEVGDWEKVAGPSLPGSAQHEYVRRYSTSVLLAL